MSFFLYRHESCINCLTFVPMALSSSVSISWPLFFSSLSSPPYFLLFSSSSLCAFFSLLISHLSASLFFVRYSTSITSSWPNLVLLLPGDLALVTRYESAERRRGMESTRENQRRSLNYLSLQMEVFLLLWSAICLLSDSSIVWVWEQCQRWAINASEWSCWQS